MNLLEKLNEICEDLKGKKDKLHQYNLVSSTMWHCKL
jgi:uncharacterized protein YoxC